MPLSEPESCEETETEPGPGSGPGSVVQLSQTCQYCGERLTAQAEAEHIRSNHRQLTFSCRLCREDTRYLYYNIRDVLTHQR